MAVENSQVEARPASPAIPAKPIGFALNFISGRGLLSARERKLGPLDLKILEMEIPGIAFPFDVTGGADRFKTHRCKLRHLVVGFDSDGIAELLRRKDLSRHGFVELKSAVRDGYLELAGRFAVGEHQADFILRAALLISSPEEVSVVFYDSRTYGWLPIPSALLPVYLKRGLELALLGGERAGAWTLKPVPEFLREFLPRSGWKIPDTRDAQLVAAEVARGQMVIAAGPEGEPTQRQIAEREPPPAAARAGEGIVTFAKAEEALHKGDIAAAYERYREAIDDERGGPWARERLLQIGAADPELALETRQVAEEVLAQDPHHAQALLALAAIAIHERSWGEAANRYGQLAEVARENKDRFDAIAAELAAAQAAAPIDPGGALAAYERAAARARDSVTAHRALFELRAGAGNFAGAAQAGERLVQIETEPAKRALAHSELGQLYLARLADYKRARMHFERALRLAPDDPAALEGLAETFAARGEPARAASYLARLAEQAEQSDDKNRIMSLNLRLGDIWERWLNDPESAATRYHRVLDIDPRNRKARLRLAKLAEERGELARARSLYEDVLAVAEEVGDPAAVPDLVAAYTRLASMTLASDGPTPEAIACLERAVELDPQNRAARDQLSQFLRERGEWGRLVHVLEEAARVGGSPEEVRRSRLDAARLELEQRKDKDAARKHLDELLTHDPADREALDLWFGLHPAAGERMELVTRLQAAADATPEPALRASFLYRLAAAREQMGLDPDLRLRDLEAALDANPYHLAAAQALVKVVEGQRDHQRVQRAFERLAIASDTSVSQADALVQRAAVLWRDLRRTEEAKNALRQALRLEPAHLAAWVALSRMLEAEGDVGGARRDLESALRAAAEVERNPGALHERLAEVTRALGDTRMELEHATQALAAGVRNMPLVDRVVELFGARNEHRRAAELLEQWSAAEHTPEGDALSMRAAELRRAVGDVEEASALYRRVVERRGQHAALAAGALERIAVERNDFKSVATALAFQIEMAPATQVPAIEVRLMRAQIESGDLAGADSASSRVLARDPQSAAALLVRARLTEARGEWKEALKGYTTILFEMPREGQERVDRRQAYERAAALLRELDPAKLDALGARFEKEFPEAPPSALARPLGELLASEGRWQALLTLRQSQLQAAPPQLKVTVRREIAQILHLRLDRGEEAIPHYQDVVGNRPDDTESRAALAQILESLGRYGDVASLLFALSQLAASPEEAVEMGVRSAEMYMEKVGDHGTAMDVLRTVVGYASGPEAAGGRLVTTLRALHMVSELVQVLERGVESHPDPDDPHFAELVDLLASSLGDAVRAVQWCQRMIEAYGASDTPQRVLIDLLDRHPQAGDVSAALRAWAAARQGAARANVLVELSERQRGAGDDNASLATLADAATADPTSETILQQLVDRYTARGKWQDAITWMERLAVATPRGTAREARLRRIVELATEYTEAPGAATHALAQLETRNDSETKMLAQLYARTGDVEGLTKLSGVTDSLDLSSTLSAAKALADKQRFETAKRFLERAMDMGGALDAWEVAGKAWRSAGRLAELGHWRVARGKTAGATDQKWLQMVGMAELVEAGEVPKHPAGDLDKQLAALSLRESESAWTAFCGAKAGGKVTWLDRATTALERLLAEDDPRLLVVLRGRIELEIKADNPEGGIEAARRLMTLGDREGARLLELVLEKAGRVEELVTMLSQRAQANGGDAPAVWTRIASLHASRKAWDQTVLALQKVPAETRPAGWAQLAFEAGAAQGDLMLQAEAAEAGARTAPDTGERAKWLVRRGQILWWHLGLAAEGRQLLVEAQHIAPRDAQAVQAEVEAHLQRRDAEAALRAIEEGLAVLSGQDSAALWLKRAELGCDVGQTAQALDSVRKAFDLIGPAAPLWQRAANVAERAGDVKVSVQALARAYGLDSNFEGAYTAALERAGDWETLVQTLEARAQSLDKTAGAERLRQAASVVYGKLGDKERSLAIMERVVKASPTAENLRAAFKLASELSRHDVLAALGEPLLRRLGADHRERIPVLHAYISALAAVGVEHEARPAIEELVQRKAATGAEKRLLARVLGADDKAGAATLLEDAVRDLDPAERGPAFFDAAQAWLLAGDSKAARKLIKKALESGVDTLEAHLLALEMLDGSDRLTSLGRVLAAQADRGFEPAKRAALRQELAAAYLEAGNPDGAKTLLAEAKELGRAPGWADTMEAVLQALGRPLDVAALWMEEAHPGGGWEGAALARRMREAARIYQEHSDTFGELRALQVLTRLSPKDSAAQNRLVEVAAQLGDKDQFLTHVRGDLAAAQNDEARASLAMRYAPLLHERFDDAPAAVSLLEDSFKAAPSSPLAEMLAHLLVAVGNPGAAIKTLVGQAQKVEGRERTDLLLKAARLAQGPANNASTAFAIYHQVIKLDAQATEARDYCIPYAESHGLWQEALDVLERAAGGAGSAKEAHALFMRAADVARDQIHDAEREAKLLAAAVDRMPTDTPAVTRLIEQLLRGSDFDGALGLALGGQVARERELELGTRLCKGLSAAGRTTEVTQLKRFLATRHPQSPIAAEARLAEARAAGDHSGVLREAQAQLVADSLDDAMRGALLVEASGAARALGQTDEAMRMLVEAATLSDADLEIVRQAAKFADEAGDEGNLSRVLHRAAELSDAIAARAQNAPGDRRAEWLALLGGAHDAAGLGDQALADYEAALRETKGAVSKHVVDRLGQLYEERGDAGKMVELLDKQAQRAPSEAQRADWYCRLGSVYQDRLKDDAKAGDAYARALKANPAHAGAQLASALLLHRHQQYLQALPLLLEQVDPGNPSAPLEHVLALVDCLRNTGDHDHALEVAARALDLHSDRVELLVARAETLEAAGRGIEAEAEWLRYLELLGSAAHAEQIAAVRRRVAQSALQRQDPHTAIGHLEEAHRALPGALDVVTALRALYEATDRFSEAAELRLREAAATDDPKARAEQFKALAAIFRDKLNDSERAQAMLAQASGAAPDDPDTLRAQLDYYASGREWAKFLETGDRLLKLGIRQGLDAVFYARMAHASLEVQGDETRAKELFAKAHALNPKDPEVRAEYAAFAKATGDFATYAQVESDALELVADPEQKVARLMELAEVYVQQLGDLPRATAMLDKARALKPDDPEVTRLLADTCALNPATYAQATELYRKLVEANPIDPHVLRIVARLYGQLGDNDRAYCAYAALLVLAQHDEEAKRFVEACRPAVPAAPQRALTDGDRMLGLIHPDQSGPLEELFAPLARFAELCRPGDLAALGISERDKLAPTDPRATWLKQVLEPLGLGQTTLYLWRGGGFACKSELVGQPTILIGSTLATDATDRQRAFLVARAAELYRTGHTLCENMPGAELGGVCAALALAIRPDAAPPGATHDTPQWANLIAAPMNDQIRAAMAPKVQAYLQAAPTLDVGRWKWAALSTAGRVALTLACDIEDAMTALLRLRGFDDVTDEQRAVVIQESPEALDLFRFALSEKFFKLRHTLGLALRRAK